MSPIEWVPQDSIPIVQDERPKVPSMPGHACRAGFFETAARRSRCGLQRDAGKTCSRDLRRSFIADGRLNGRRSRQVAKSFPAESICLLHFASWPPSRRSSNWRSWSISSAEIPDNASNLQLGLW